MKNDNEVIIERYGDPSDFDHAPFLSVLRNNADGSGWVQLNRDDQLPLWERFSSLQDALDFIQNKKNI